MTAIYCDQAATSFPKPETVPRAVAAAMTEQAASPGRSAHRYSLAAARVVFGVRESMAELLGVDDSSRIAFTLNVTHALNLALAALARPGTRVLTTGLEHNSVMRPLTRLAEERGLTVDVVPIREGGLVHAEDFSKRLRPDTGLVVVNHASNVTGAVAPLEEIRTATGAIPLVVDAAQSAGAVPLGAPADYCDVLAFTGHKGLLGPTGTGGLWVRPGLDLTPLVQGGTGSRSEFEDHPDFMPDSLEAGTPNTHGLAGLAAGIDFVLETGPDRIREHEQQLTTAFMDGLSSIKGATVYGPPASKRTAVVSLNLDGWSSSDLALALDREYGIMTRAGLHCAPRAHRSIGTMPQGTVRFSFGWFNTLEEVDAVLAALKTLAASR